MSCRRIYSSSIRKAMLTVVLAVVFTGNTLSQTTTVDDGSIPVQMEVLVQWSPELDENQPDFELTPTRVVSLRDGTGRMLVATLGGTIRVMQPNGMGFDLLAAPLINSSQTGFEMQQESGMTSIALHPNFAGDSNDFGYGLLYTITVEDGSGNGGLTNSDVDFPYNGDIHQDVVREWDISPIVGQAGVNSLPALSVSDSRELLRVDQPGFCHNVVDLAFDPSAGVGDDNFGLLFITVGDGCGTSSTVDSQDPGRVYGKLLRIDPDPTAHALVRITSNSTAPNAGQPTYSIPSTNPFNGDDGVEDREANTLAEVFAYGLRSPYRLGFDSQTGDMFIGDVGQGSREEVTQIQSATNGGWGRYEGTRLNQDIPLQGPSPHTEPLFEYTTAVGKTVVGGLVYRGSSIPELQGKYVFADFGNLLASGKLFYGSVNPSDPDFGVMYSLVLDPDGAVFPIDTNGDSTPDTDAFLPDRIFGISEDENGELLLIAGQDPRRFLPSVPGAYIIRVTESDLIIDDPPNNDPIENPVIINLDLNYNFNGIVHANESADPTSDPNHPNGFRSISDRALDFRNGIPGNSTLDDYQLIGSGGVLDIVHLGNRNTVSGGGQPFDDQVDGDDLGIQPNWLANPDQTGRQTSVLGTPVELTNLADLAVVFQISNGGGSFEVVLGYSDGSEESFTAAGPDWFGPFGGEPNIGTFPGTQSIDRGNPGDDLLLTESVFRIPNSLGRIVTEISFENASNFNGGVAVVAANLVVEEACLLGDVDQDGVVNLLDVQPLIELISTGDFQCEADVNEDQVVNLLDVGPFIDILSGN